MFTFLLGGNDLHPYVVSYVEHRNTTLGITSSDAFVLALDTLVKGIASLGLLSDLEYLHTRGGDSVSNENTAFRYNLISDAVDLDAAHEVVLSGDVTARTAMVTNSSGPASSFTRFYRDANYSVGVNWSLSPAIRSVRVFGGAFSYSASSIAYSGSPPHSYALTELANNTTIRYNGSSVSRSGTAMPAGMDEWHADQGPSSTNEVSLLTNEGTTWSNSEIDAVSALLDAYSSASSGF